MTVNLITKETEFPIVSDLENSCGLDKPAARPVEVSGWDVNMRFFVEQTHVEESEPGVKTVALRNRIGSDALVFVRLLGSPAPDSRYPIACQPLFSRPAANGVSTVALVELRSGKRSEEMSPARLLCI
jgi:hypothetical protein